MAMGFNTDIKHKGVVYHIQTEARKDASIDTLVYQKGAIIHKLTTPYKAFLESPDFSEEKLHKMLEAQHRQVIARIRAGEIQPPGSLTPAGAGPSA